MRRILAQEHERQEADIEREIARRVALQMLQRGTSGA